MKLNKITFISAFVFFSMGMGAQAETVIPDLLKKYETQSGTSFSADRGKAMWVQEFKFKDGSTRSCVSCHGANLKKEGKHIKTKKIIAAMAPSTNAKRYTKEKMVEKWFKRNCKWTLGRECTPKEKGDFLAYLQNL